MTEQNLVANSQVVAAIISRAELCLDQRAWADADTLFQQAMQLDKSFSSRISYGVGLASQERYFEAISAFTPVLDGNDRSAIGVVCHNLAAIYRDVGDLDLARRFQWRATLLHEESGCEDLLGMANEALTGECPEIAASLIMTAQEVNEADGDGLDGDLIGMTALIKRALESTEDAIVTFAAYKYHQSTEDLRSMGIDLVNMSSLFGEVDRHRAERACLVRAIRCFEKAPAPFSRHRAVQQLNKLDRMRVVRSFDPRRN